MSGVGEAAYQTIVPAFIENKLLKEEDKGLLLHIYLFIFWYLYWYFIGLILGDLWHFWEYIYLLYINDTIIYFIYTSSRYFRKSKF